MYDIYLTVECSHQHNCTKVYRGIHVLLIIEKRNHEHDVYTSCVCTQYCYRQSVNKAIVFTLKTSLRIVVWVPTAIFDLTNEYIPLLLNIWKQARLHKPSTRVPISLHFIHVPHLLEVIASELRVRLL